MDLVIKVSNLRKVYTIAGAEGEVHSVSALNGVDLEIKQGEYVAIIGPSGSGKSTLMQILGLLDKFSEGSYSFLGQDIKQLSDDQIASLRSRYIGFVFQLFNLLPRATALENVELPLIYSQVPDRKNIAAALLERVGLKERANHRSHQLSGGQQQRVAIARALVNRPKLILADEPTGNVNQQQSKEILRQLDELHASGVTIILVTHDPNVAAHAKRIITIVDGKISSDEIKAIQPAPSTETKISISAQSLFNLNLLTENFQMALKALLINKLRTGLTMLGIIIGVGSVISMMALGEGAKQAIQQRLKSLGSNLLSIRPGNPKIGHVVREAGSSTRLTTDDADAISALKSSGVPIQGVSSEVRGAVQVVYGNKNWSTQLQGVSPSYAELRASNPEVGRFFTENENLIRSRVCLLGKTVYKNLFQTDESPVGAFIKINRINFRVIGILPEKGASTFGDRDDVVVVPILTAMQRVLGKRYVSSIDVQVSDETAIETTMDSIQELIRKRHRIGQNQEDDFDIRNMADLQQALSSTTQTMTLLLGAIAVISLIVGGIGVMNIMMVSVKERTREIGLRKAVGARSTDVLFQFLIEAVMIGLLGGVIGLLLGAGVSFSLTYFFDWTTKLSILSIMVAFLSSFSVGVIFGYWPARQASRLSPIEALRYE